MEAIKWPAIEHIFEHICVQLECWPSARLSHPTLPDIANAPEAELAERPIAMFQKLLKRLLKTASSC